MTLDEILQMWSQDAKTDSTQIATAALDIAMLHAKYLSLFSHERLRLKQLEQNNIRLRANKRDWMLGELSKDELDALGWKPWLRATPLKSQLDELLSSDEDCLKEFARIAMQTEKVNALDSIIRLLNNRSFQLSVAMNFIKFQNGVN